MMSTINGGHYQTISTSVSAGTPDAYDQSTAADDLAGRGLLSRSHRKARSVPLASVPTSPPIPRINAEIESARRSKIKKTFSSE